VSEKRNRKMRTSAGPVGEDAGDDDRRLPVKSDLWLTVGRQCTTTHNERFVWTVG